MFVAPDRKNAATLRAALVDFGFGDLAPSVSDLARAGRVWMLGRKPRRIDILTSATGGPSAPTRPRGSSSHGWHRRRSRPGRSSRVAWMAAEGGRPPPRRRDADVLGARPRWSPKSGRRDQPEHSPLGVVDAVARNRTIEGPSYHDLPVAATLSHGGRAGSRERNRAAYGARDSFAPGNSRSLDRSRGSRPARCRGPHPGTGSFATAAPVVAHALPPGRHGNRSSFTPIWFHHDSRLVAREPLLAPALNHQPATKGRGSLRWRSRTRDRRFRDPRRPSCSCRPSCWNASC